MAKSSQDRFTFSRVKTSRPTSQLKRYAYKTAAFGLSVSLSHWRYGWPIEASRRASLGNANSILGENQIQLIIVWHDGYNDFGTFSFCFSLSLSLSFYGLDSTPTFPASLAAAAAVISTASVRTHWVGERARASNRRERASACVCVCVFPRAK